MRPGLPVAPAEESVQDQHATLERKVRRSALWTGASTILMRLSSIAVIAVVARIISPKDFGVFALAVTVQAILTGFAELGVASVIARSELDIDRIAPTVVTISVVTSGLLAAVMAAFAAPIATTLGSPEAEGPVRVLAITIALIGPFAVPGAQLQRNFRQDILFWATLSSFVVSSLVLIALALVGDGATAFAWSRVAGQLVGGLVMICSLKRNYLPGFTVAYLQPLLRFGLPLAGANLLSQALLNVDYIFVGRMMSTQDVGLYMLAFNICMWSAAVIGSMLNGIVLPAFSTVKRDHGDVPAAIESGLRAVCIVACPLAAFTCAFAEPLVAVIYGPHWVGAASVLTVLSFYGVAFVVGLLFANILISMGRTGPLFAVQGIALGCLLPALWAGITFGGLVGLGLAHLLVIGLVTLPVYIRSLRRSVGIAPSRLVRAVARPAGSAFGAALVALAATLPVHDDVLRVAVGGVVGAAVYSAACWRHVRPLLRGRNIGSKRGTRASTQ